LKKSIGFFITGTDTEVGKTLVAGAFIIKLKEAGFNAIGFKPVVAGTFQDGNGVIHNEDLDTLRIASGLNKEQENICPYVLDIPAAPHLVAASHGVELKSDVILLVFEQLVEKYDCIVVEGAGGFLVPLNQTETLGDIALAMHMPVILVVGMQLGCINHALLTYEAMHTRKIDVAGWIANTLSEDMSFLQENIQTLQARIDAPLLGIIPNLPKNLEKQANSAYSIDALRFAAQHMRLP
jgi:dethiobiotin synthetase